MEVSNRKGKKISYFYNSEIGKFYYGKDHPMKPKRVAMTHTLIQQFGLYNKMDIYLARAATDQEMMQFHSKEYIKFLSNFVSSNVSLLQKYIPFDNGYCNEFNQRELTEEEKAYNIYNPKSQQLHKVNQVTDCPGFDGLYNFCQISAGGSIDAAHLIINQEADIAINWGGGLHHAKKQEASGFCYVNDIVIGILELLKYYPRVVYLDIDVHHGDGVEEAFFLTNRVMTVSFHQFGDDFFPGSGDLYSKGEGLGLNHSINVPIKPGITDDQYQELFKNIMSKVMSSFRPDVIVLQAGADSIAYDKLGQFNLSTIGRGKCVDFMLKQGVPVMLLGGGGYNVPNVSRCWAYETSIALGIDQPADTVIPSTDTYYDQYYPDHKLHINAKQNFENKNDAATIQKIESTILEYLRQVETSPGFQFHYVPEYFNLNNEDKIDEEEFLGFKEGYGAEQVNKAQAL